MVNTIERERVGAQKASGWKVATIALALVALGLAIWAWSLNGQLSQMQNMHKSMMGSGSMGSMMSGSSMDDNLKGSGSDFDRNFIDAMIPHHQSAVKMGRQALNRAGHQEIKTMAQNIISAQEREIAQLEQWRRDWF